MADYAADINTADYLYKREITVTEKEGNDQTDLHLRLQLDSSNFNFDVAGVPKMENTKVNAYSMTHWASQVFQGAKENPSDGDYTTYWRVNTSTSWWRVDLVSSTNITGLRLRRWSSATNDQMIQNFRVSGSHNNSTWVTIYNGTAASNGNLQTFSFSNDTAYRYYKLDILSNYGHSYTTMGLIDFVGEKGTDNFRLAEASNGTGVLNMFIGYWDKTLEQATMYFKLPSLLADETKTLYAFWGNTTDSGISDIHSLDFYLSDHFDDSTIYNANWGTVGNGTVTNFYTGDAGAHTTVRVINATNQSIYIQSDTDPIPPLSSWATEMGYWMYEDTDINDTWKYSHRISFYGAGVPQIFNYFAADGEDSGYFPGGIVENEGTFGPRVENFQYAGSTYPDDYVGYLWGALVLDSYHQNFFGYYLPTEGYYIGMYNRNPNRISSNCPPQWDGNYLETDERRIEGNSDHTRVRIWGATRGSYAEWAGTEVYFDWVIVRKYLGPYEPEWDLSDLYVQYEQINHETIVWGYGDDITDVGYDHTTSSGGEPTKLSDNKTGVGYVWCSVDGAASDQVDLSINYSTHGGNLVSFDYLHYDDGHVNYFNAAKLSDQDEDINNNNYWHGTTTSGWAVIDFESPIYKVGILMVQGVAGSLNGMAKNYKIEGSFTYENDFEHTSWKTLAQGTFSKTTDWQTVYFYNDTRYRFYRLKVLDTYGDNIAIQEWKMYRYYTDVGKKVVSKVKIKPVSYDSQYLYFPKQIAFYGSNDGANWTTLIPTKNTYTPLDAKWQEHAFENTTPFYIYRLRCIGNWNNNAGPICIAEWEMMEKETEQWTYRILAGSGNNFNSVWAEDDCTFDSGIFYTVNNKINVVDTNQLVNTVDVTGTVKDLNVD